MIQDLRQKDGMPKFSEAPRYKLLEKAYLSAVKVKKGKDWVPFEEVLLDPSEQPPVNALPGPYGGRGDRELLPLEIEFLGIPDDHMEPLNEAGRWMLDHVDELKEKARLASKSAKRGRHVNPIDALTILGPGAEVLKPVADSV